MCTSTEVVKKSYNYNILTGIRIRVDLHPAICSNQGCGVTVNKRDLVHHESEVCEQRKLKCHSCEEMVKTLADVSKRVENVDKNMSTNLTVKTEMAV